ncbi:hypothetical protein PtA15_10A332 [Puccinia triticina]|uniref:Uncharacterized protein n=1 Tax=Puccinia triticina TaxID=208348 RepID=A0ABY7CYP1_9BASI|nr:uncharacterized protein PtA15_10A332 [Puccinia triticina]WAQ88910.1 hypothetical protein PtA15_10A332 [Puccinia triticina]WAR58963.1 hypothetical protein PtB15_10B304 [Puccinia triticina]
MHSIKISSTPPVVNADHGSIKESSTPRDNTPSFANATQGSGSAGDNNVGSPLAAPALEHRAPARRTRVKPPPTRTVRRSLRIFRMTHNLGHFTATEGYTEKSGASRRAHH